MEVTTRILVYHGKQNTPAFTFLLSSAGRPFASPTRESVHFPKKWLELAGYYWLQQSVGALGLTSAWSRYPGSVHGEMPQHNGMQEKVTMTHTSGSRQPQLQATGVMRMQ